MNILSRLTPPDDDRTLLPNDRTPLHDDCTLLPDDRMLLPDDRALPSTDHLPLPADHSLLSDEVANDDHTQLSHADTPPPPIVLAEESPAAPQRMDTASQATQKPRMFDQQDMAWFRERFEAMVDAVSRAVVGKRAQIELCVIALMAGGHILLEDGPGTGKTQLARALARTVGVSCKRIQFTADLLPSDVTGVMVFDRDTGRFHFREGPVFSSFVLADEINRASPKTQSALLEVMEERTVTVDGVSHQVPHLFVVIATQNPEDQLGTYRLPEAQLDRFLLRTSLGAPGRDASMALLRQLDVPDRASLVGPVMGGDELNALISRTQSVHTDDAVLAYAVRVVEATRQHPGVVSGVSMRGTMALMRVCRVHAAAKGRDYVVPDDVKSMAGPVLAHRLVRTQDSVFDGIGADDILAQILDEVPVPAHSR